MGNISILLLNVLPFFQCRVPSQWKISVIIPLHNKGTQPDPVRTGPINHLANVLRIIQFSIQMQLMICLTNNRLAKTGQHGLSQKKLRSTRRTNNSNAVTTAAVAGKSDSTRKIPLVLYATLG